MHAAGVSLMLSGETIANDGFVDSDDVGAFGNSRPSNSNSNGALLCVTDLVDCCAAPRAVRGDWYYPDNRTVGESGFGFIVNRGASDQQTSTSGSVRLFRVFSAAPERGRFRCEIPNAAGVNQIIYLNICEFYYSCS